MAFHKTKKSRGRKRKVRWNHKSRKVRGGGVEISTLNDLYNGQNKIREQQKIIDETEQKEKREREEREKTEQKEKNNVYKNQTK